MRLKRFNESVDSNTVYTVVAVHEGEEKVLSTFTKLIYAADYMIKWTNEYIHDDFYAYDDWIQDGDIPESGYFEPFFDESGKSNFFHESSDFNLDENEDWDRCKVIQNTLCDTDCVFLVMYENKLYNSPFKGEALDY